MSASSINSDRELTVKTNKKSFGLWFKEVGWKHIITWALLIYALFPILYIISTSLTDFGGIENAALFQQFHWQNYRDLMTDPSYPFPKWMLNTVIIAGSTAVLSVFISACAAYSFSRLRFKGRRPGLLALILVQMFPSVSGLVAIFGILSWLTDNVPAFGLGTKAGLILVYLGGSLGAGTYLMYGFFNTVPAEIDEAAKIITEAADPDANTTLTYSLSGGPDVGLFNINAITVEAKEGIFEGNIRLYVHDKEELDELIAELKSLPGIQSVERYNLES